MEEKYKNIKCKLCRTLCTVKQVKESNRNNNAGKWYLRCPKVYKGGHTFEFDLLPEQTN